MNYIFVLLSFVLLIKNKNRIIFWISENYKYIIMVFLLYFCNDIAKIYEFLTKIIH